MTSYVVSDDNGDLIRPIGGRWESSLVILTTTVATTSLFYCCCWLNAICIDDRLETTPRAHRHDDVQYIGMYNGVTLLRKSLSESGLFVWSMGFKSSDFDGHTNVLLWNKPRWKMFGLVLFWRNIKPGTCNRQLLWLQLLLCIL